MPMLHILSWEDFWKLAILSMLVRAKRAIFLLSLTYLPPEPGPFAYLIHFENLSYQTRILISITHLVKKMYIFFPLNFKNWLIFWQGFRSSNYHQRDSPRRIHQPARVIPHHQWQQQTKREGDWGEKYPWCTGRRNISVTNVCQAAGWRRQSAERRRQVRGRFAEGRKPSTAGGGWWGGGGSWGKQEQDEEEPENLKRKVSLMKCTFFFF